jgi:antiviral helicase SKI2
MMHEVEKALGEEPEESVLIDGEINAQSSGVEDHETSNGHLSSEDEEEDIDSLLPVEYPALEPRGPLALSTSKRGGREWAHMVDINRDIPNFQELVPDMAKLAFRAVTFQKEAVYHLENGDSVFVAAHTSAGKNCGCRVCNSVGSKAYDQSHLYVTNQSSQQPEVP